MLLFNMDRNSNLVVTLFTITDIYCSSCHDKRQSRLATKFFSLSERSSDTNTNFVFVRLCDDQNAPSSGYMNMGEENGAFRTKRKIVVWGNDEWIFSGRFGGPNKSVISIFEYFRSFMTLPTSKSRTILYLEYGRFSFIESFNEISHARTIIL
jgi:hypothetical protein